MEINIILLIAHGQKVKTARPKFFWTHPAKSQQSRSQENLQLNFNRFLNNTTGKLKIFVSQQLICLKYLPGWPESSHHKIRCLLPFFFGPLQMTASLGLANKKPTDITPRLSSTY